MASKYHTVSYSSMDKALHRRSGLDLILVGKTGNGKSATGNKILGKYYFAEGFDMCSETTQASTGWNLINDRSIVVCDTPGLFDTEMETEQSYKQALKAFIDGLKMCSEGFHAVIVVLSVNSRMTKEELDSIRLIERMLGGRVLKDYGVIVFTNGDSFRSRTKGKLTFDEWLQRQNGPMKEIFEACGYRCVLFDNVTLDEDLIKRQRDELIQAIDQLRFQGRRYTSEMFNAIQEEWKLAQEKGKKPDIAKEVYLRLGRFGAELNNIVRTKKYDKSIIAGLRRELEVIDDLNSQLDVDDRKIMSRQIADFRDTLDELETSGIGRFLKESVLPFLGTVVLPTVVSVLVGSAKPLARLAATGLQTAAKACPIM